MIPPQEEMRERDEDLASSKASPTVLCLHTSIRQGLLSFNLTVVLG